MKLSLCPQLRLGIICISPLITAALLAACGNDDSSTDGDRIKVVTTLPLFADFVRQIGGDRVEVVALLPSGADPHTWEPSPSDVRKIAEADIAFANGLNLEPSAEKLITANLRSGAEYVRLAERAQHMGVGVINDNPHLWLDIEYAKLYVAAIRDSLIGVDVTGKSEYDKAHDAFAANLDDTADYVRNKVSGIPEGNRNLVTTHDAFLYLAQYLDLLLVAVVAEGPGQEARPDDIARLVMALDGQGVPAVFVEPQINAESDVLRQAASDAGVQVCTLYSDSLDNRVTTYVELMRFNADELARCLGGDDEG